VCVLAGYPGETGSLDGAAIQLGSRVFKNIMLKVVNHNPAVQNVIVGSIKSMSE